MNISEQERDRMSMALDAATRGKHWKEEIETLFAGDNAEGAKRLVRAIVFFRGQVANVTCPMSEATFRAVGTFAGFRVYVPSCFDGSAGEGWFGAHSDYVLQWSGWEGPTAHTFSMADVLEAAEA